MFPYQALDVLGTAGGGRCHMQVRAVFGALVHPTAMAMQAGSCSDQFVCSFVLEGESLMRTRIGRQTWSS